MMIMKPFSRLLLIYSFIACSCSPKQNLGIANTTGAGQLYYQLPASTRQAKTINTNWAFNYFPAEDADKGFEAPAFDDKTWPIVALPHTWSTYETTGELHPFIRNASEAEDPYWWNGWGWYRKHFVPEQSLAGKKLFIEFDGAQKYSKVWLNGKLLGDHKGGFTSFYFDITDYVKWGEDNVLALAISNRRTDPMHIPPMMAGNWNPYGGIYRDVRLVVKDPLHIPFQGDYRHEGGTFVTTPKVTEQEALVQVQTWVKNDAKQPRRVKLRTIIADSTGLILQTLEASQMINPGGLQAFKQISKPVLQPWLWSPERPYVYRVYTEVYDDKQLTDTYQSPLGFRYFKWNYAEKRLYLNGKKMHIHGTNRHQEYPWLGDAIPKWIHTRDLHDIRYNLNHNFMRGAHYTNDKYVYDYADRHGLMMAEEVPNIKNIDFDEDVQEQQVKEMIRRDRNHPSILFWSLGNETNDAADSKWARAEDTTRIIHARHVSGPSAGDFAPHTHEQMDMENLLRCTVRGWYNEDVKNLAPANGQHTGHEEHQHRTARIEGASQRGRMDMGNGVMWIYADHGAKREYVNNPLKFVNPKGWVDSYRVPKYMYYLWQANYAEKPMVFIHPHFWRRQYVGQQKDIVIDSNGERVELFVNGKSFGTLNPTTDNFHTVTFKNILIAAGELKAIAYKGNTAVEHKVIMAGEPAKITLQASHRQLPANPASVAIVTADIVDKNNVHVYGATNTLRWEVSGPARLVGAPVYSSDIHKKEDTEGTMYIDAPVSNVLRATGEAGTITVRVTAGGLIAGTITLESQPVTQNSSLAIKEPILNPQNRLPVARNAKVTAKALVVPKEIKEDVDDIHFTAASEKAYTALMQAILLKRNPTVSTNTIEFNALLNLFATHLQHNKGELVADDYNFNINLYNQARYLTQIIQKSTLPRPYQEYLRGYYATEMITKGVTKNLLTETQKLQNIPATGSQLFRVGTGKKEKETQVTTAKTLAVLVSTTYPEFGKLAEKQQNQMKKYILSLHPTLNSFEETLPQGQVILLPAYNIIQQKVELK